MPPLTFAILYKRVSKETIPKHLYSDSVEALVQREFSITVETLSITFLWKYFEY